MFVPFSSLITSHCQRKSGGENMFYSLSMFSWFFNWERGGGCAPLSPRCYFTKHIRASICHHVRFLTMIVHEIPIYPVIIFIISPFRHLSYFSSLFIVVHHLHCFSWCFNFKIFDSFHDFFVSLIAFSLLFITCSLFFVMFHYLVLLFEKYFLLSLFS